MIAIIDYGLGNIRSVQNALSFLGQESILTHDKNEILSASKVILPGVGAFKEGMANINQLGLKDTLIAFSQSSKPLLGICLGFQLLTESSEEFGHEKGLGILDARCAKLEPGENQSLPNVGWSEVLWEKNNSALSQYLDKKSFYFIHSFGVFSDNKDLNKGMTTYGKQQYISMIQKDNVLGVQFHPEKSGKDGIDLLNYFVQLGNQ